MRKLTLVAAALATTTAIMAQTGETHVKWENLGNDLESYTQRITVTGELGFDKLGFNMFDRKMTVTTPQVTLTEMVPGYYTLTTPAFKAGADSVVIDIVTKGTMANCSYAPDGFHRIYADGRTAPVIYTRMPLTRRDQWCVIGGTDRMPYGDAIYDFNASLAGGNAGVYDVIPSYKDVTLTGGLSTLPMQMSWHEVTSDRPEGYRIIIGGDSIVIEAADEATYRMAAESFYDLVVKDSAGQLPNAVITDWPDYPYRGLMIDIVRNFQPMSELRRIVDYMAQYRMNMLHLHFADDEAWRIEIPALPELTDYASHRGYSEDEADFLFQIYSGDGNPLSTEGVSNGHYTRDQFVDFLRYAKSKGVNVIPEVEMPGHARAAVKAMEKRYRTTGDDTYRLIHDGDTSTYTSAQAYHDNVMNPALPGPYRFMDVVFDAIIDMYREADAPLLAIHIGGDEVAKGAWSGSQPAQQVIAERGLNGQTGFHGWFVEQIADMLARKGVKMSGWQEIAVGHTPEYNASMAPITYSVNCWTNSNPDPSRNTNSRSASAGFPTVVSNVDHFYLDMCYSYHPEEPGLKWGGVVDEFQSLHGYPRRLVPLADPNDSVNVIGVSGQVFAETLRSPAMLEYYLFPKMCGLAERAWNAEPTYNDADYNAVIQRRELPRWSKTGRNFHLRQPGIKVVDGKILMNSPYDNAQIRYTLDGTDPTEDSPLYRGAIDSTGVGEVRARMYMYGKESVPTVLFIQ